jgi:hypothetical protein
MEDFPALDFHHGETIDMLRATVRAFAADEIAPRAGEIDRSNQFPTDLWRKMGDLGLLGITVDDEYGGSYPGLFRPVKYNGTYLVDGAMAMEVPAEAVRRLGATHVISVCLTGNGQPVDPRNMFQVVSRSFQIMHGRTEHQWRRHSTLVIEPDASGVGWDRFDAADRLIEAGEKAALAALPRIKAWLEAPKAAEAGNAAPARPLEEAV